MSVDAGHAPGPPTCPRATQLAAKFRALGQRAEICWTWSPELLPGSWKNFASAPDPDMAALDGFTYVAHDAVRNWHTVDVLILAVPEADRSAQVLEYQQRNPQMLILLWLWDNHLAPAHNLQMLMTCDMYFPAHAYRAAYLSNLHCPMGLHVPPAVAQWTGVEARALLAELSGTIRSDQVLLNYVDDHSSQRPELPEQLRAELNLPLTLHPADEQGHDLSPSSRERLAEQLGHKCTLILTVEQALSTRVFEALLAGLVVIAPRLLADFDQVFPPEVQSRLGMVRIDNLALPTIRAGIAQAAENFDRLGAAGVLARAEFVLAGHMLHHRLHTMLLTARTAAQRREWLDYPGVIAEAATAVTAGRFDAAIAAFQLAMHGPAATDPAARYKFGTTLLLTGRTGEAMTQFETILAQDPSHRLAGNNYAVALTKQNRISEAEAVLQRVLERHPDYSEALINLAHCLTLQGRTREAEALCRQVLARDPNHRAAGSSLLLTMLYHETDGVRLRQEHEAMAAMLTRGVVAAPPARRAPKPKIRVGFFSPDFRWHSVAYFALPLIAQLDRERFEVWCYSDVARPDQVTARFQQHADRYIPIFGRSDEEVAGQIKADGIDILFDLAGHSGTNRIRLFAAHPAARQVSWLGYPSTTGLPAMDYRLTDALADPAGNEAYYTERLIRLAGGFLCYLGANDAPVPNALPMLARGYVTFGSFNNAAKIQPETVRLWSRVLQSLPRARLLLKARPFNNPQIAGHVAALFAAEGIAASRIDLRAQTEGTTAHLAAYGEIDIALDTLPYSGTTTTCEALWMGVPVITRAGTVHQSRVGASLLSQVGLGSLVATTDEHFLAKAVYLASNTAQLAGLRRGLRPAMAASPLCDSRRFAREFGEALQRIMTEA